MSTTIFTKEFNEVIWPTFVTRSKSTPKTIHNLKQYLEKLVTFSKKDVCAIEPKDASSFIEHLYQSISKGEYKPSYVRVIFISLRKFYQFLIHYKYDFKDRGIMVPTSNPFESIRLAIPEKQLLTAEDIPTIEELDLLLAGAKKINQSLYLSICLAAKLGLSISEISNLRTSAIGYMKEEFFYESIAGIHEKNLYLCLSGNTKNTKRYLKVPEDLTSVIEEVLEAREASLIHVDEESEIVDLNESIYDRNDDYSSYFISYRGKHYSDRTMQFHLKNLCESLKIKPITFGDLRNLSIFLMKQGGAKDSEIAKFTGQEGRWICRFSGIDPKKVFGTAEYSRIQLI